MENARFSLQIGHADRMSTPAISNADMVEIWMLVPDDVPIDILP